MPHLRVHTRCNVQGCTVEVEPSDVDRPWSLRITERAPHSACIISSGSGSGHKDDVLDDSGGSNELLSVSADSAATLLQWVAAFSKAGLTVIWPKGGSGGSASLGLGARASSLPLPREAAGAAAAAVEAARVVAGQEVAGEGAVAACRLEGRQAEGHGGGLLRRLSSSLAPPPLMGGFSAASREGAGGGEGGQQGEQGGWGVRQGHGVGALRMPSARWLKEPAKEEFVAYLDAEQVGGRYGMVAWGCLAQNEFCLAWFNPVLQRNMDISSVWFGWVVPLLARVEGQWLVGCCRYVLASAVLATDVFQHINGARFTRLISHARSNAQASSYTSLCLQSEDEQSAASRRAVGAPFLPHNPHLHPNLYLFLYVDLYRCLCAILFLCPHVP